MNSATVEELDKELPGIGPGTARAIVEARPFRSIEELDLVRGIGPAIMEKLRAHVTLGEDEAPDPAEVEEEPPKRGKAEQAKRAEMAARARAAAEARRHALARAMLERMAAYRLQELRTLLAAAERDFQRWQEENNISSTGRLKAGVALSRRDEIRLVRQCQDWQLKISLLRKEIKDREKAMR